MKMAGPEGFEPNKSEIFSFYDSLLENCAGYLETWLRLQ